MKVVQNEVYCDIDGVSLRFDVVAPASGDGLPAVMCIHGGGWVSGDKSDMHEVARRFAMEGYTAFCPQYRLASLYPYPCAVQDCRRFVEFLREHRERFGIDPAKLSAFGNSAGGHLAAMCAMSPSKLERVDAAVDISGLTDLTNPQEQHPPISWDFIGQFMGCGFQGNESKWIEASPVYQVSAETAPILVVHGADDDIVWIEQSRKLYEVLFANNVKTEIVVLDGEGHGFTEDAFDSIIDKSLTFFDECGVGINEAVAR